MSQLQYIGARYVPIWYENTDDQSADWQSNVEYEALTFVTTINNHLYLSKKTVPDTVGNPANNIDYWLDMGVFTNAQIAQLQAQVDNIENVTIPGINQDITDTNTRITTLDPYEKFRNKTICVIGDSISDYDVLQNNWVKLLTDFMADYDCTVINESDAGRSFASLKNDIDNSTVILPAADYYILFIGLNDWQGSNNWGWSSGSNPMTTAVTSVYNSIYTKNYNAKWFFVSPMKFFVTNTINNNRTTLNCYRQYYEDFFATHGYTVLSGYNMPEMNANTVSMYTLDGLHPNSTYAPIMFKYILDGLVSERSNVTRQQTGQKTLLNTVTTASLIDFIFEGSCVDVQLQINQWSPTVNTWVDICDIPNVLDSSVFPIGYFSQSQNKCQYRLSGGKLQVFFFTYTAGSDWGDYIIFKYGINQMN